MRNAMTGLLAALLLPHAALAQGAMPQVDLAAADACFAEADAAGTNPALCIEPAQVACMDNSDSTPPVSTLCYTHARGAWSGAVGGVIEGIDARGDTRLGAVARIEARYDLLINLLHCDRAEELAIAASDLDGADIALQKARCQSTAAALTYIRLFLSARANL